MFSDLNRARETTDKQAQKPVKTFEQVMREEDLNEKKNAIEE